MTVYNGAYGKMQQAFAALMEKSTSELINILNEPQNSMQTYDNYSRAKLQQNQNENLSGVKGMFPEINMYINTYDKANLVTQIIVRNWSNLDVFL